MVHVLELLALMLALYVGYRIVIKYMVLCFVTLIVGVCLFTFYRAIHG